MAALDTFLAIALSPALVEEVEVATAAEAEEAAAAATATTVDSPDTCLATAPTLLNSPAATRFLESALSVSLNIRLACTDTLTWICQHESRTPFQICKNSS